MATTDKPDHVKFELRTFTDDQIDKLIEGDNFRAMKPGHRDKLLTEMRADRWVAGNGECLAFDPSGKLLNGQHRLSAAQIYQRQNDGAKVWFWCALNVDTKASVRMDVGRTRSLIEYLRNEGVENAQLVSTIAIGESLMSMARNGSLATLVHGGRVQADSVSSKTYTYRPSLGAAIDVFRRHRGEMALWAQIGQRCKDATLPRGGLVGAIGYQLAKVNKKQAIAFYEALITGADLAEISPIYHLRQRLMAERRSKTKLTGTYIAAIFAKAWVAWCREEDMQVLRWRASGEDPEAFPDHRDVA